MNFLNRIHISLLSLLEEQFQTKNNEKKIWFIKILAANLFTSYCANVKLSLFMFPFVSEKVLCSIISMSRNPFILPNHSWNANTRQSVDSWGSFLSIFKRLQQ